MMRNPVFDSSMKRRMRSWRAPLLLTLYIVFLLVISSTALLTLHYKQVSLGNLRAGLEAYVYLSMMQFMLIVLVAPALTVGAISGERERQTLDLLLCTRVSAMHIVLGKLLSSVCFLALLIVSSLPMMMITMFFGGITIADTLVMLLFLLVSAFACCAIGIFCSTAFKRTATATVIAYLAIFAIGVGTVVIPLVLQSAQLSEALSAYNQYLYGDSSQFDSLEAIRAHIMQAMPKMLYANPALGLVSLLISQTSLLSNTMSDTFGWRGNQLFIILQQVDSIAWVNMAVMFITSLLLTVVSALFVKPSGRRPRKKK